MKLKISADFRTRQVRPCLLLGLLLTASLAQAQGLGGFLNKVKTKANQITTSSVPTPTTTAPGGLPANGEDPLPPRS